MPDLPIENQTKEEWFDTYDITVTLPLRQDCLQNTNGMKNEFIDWKH